MMMLAFFPLGVIGPWQIVIIAFVILLLFGGKKIPELMRGLGKGMKSFKEGMNEVEKQIGDIDKEMNAPAKAVPYCRLDSRNSAMPLASVRIAGVVVIRRGHSRSFQAPLMPSTRFVTRVGLISGVMIFK